MPAPIYIVSKGRADTRLTNKALAAMEIYHYIVVEEAEYQAYNDVAEYAHVLVLPPEYKASYETCDDLGFVDKSTGPGPARNFAMDHATAHGARWHWVMDDNIQGFYRLNHNLKTPCVSGRFFQVMEDFCERYEDVAMAGPNYFMFASRKTKMPPYVTNTRIYSCNLIRNHLGFRWRGRYNEDTDLSLRMLKAGYMTVQFNAMLQYKMPTQTVAGGNSAEFYDEEGTLAKSEMLARLHPEAAVTWKFNRPHHEVDYSRWRGKGRRGGGRMKVELTRHDVELATMVGVRRQVENIYSGQADFARSDEKKHGITAYGMHIVGALGECAAAKALGVYWSPSAFREPDLLGYIEVKTSGVGWFGFARTPDPDRYPVFVFVAGEAPLYEVLGYAETRDLPEMLLRLENHRWARYRLDVSRLEPIDRLAAAIARERGAEADALERRRRPQIAFTASGF